MALATGLEGKVGFIWNLDFTAMEIVELKDKKIEELQQMLKDKRNKLCRLRFELSQGKVKNLKEMKGARKDIARILTILNQKSKFKNQNVIQKVK